MNTVELFAATQSFSKVMRKYGHDTFTFDIDPQFESDVTGDIRGIKDLGRGNRADILWASPPCTAFSVASIGTHWTGGVRAYVPKSSQAKLGIELVKHTFKLIEDTRPTWWFIENPQGVLKNLPFMQNLRMHVIWYCHYGDTRAKPTTIWTNAYWWRPQGVCHNQRKAHPRNCCCMDHEAAPRGAKTGTQGLLGAKNRSRIPPALFEEILDQMPKQSLPEKEEGN